LLNHSKKDNLSEPDIEIGLDALLVSDFTLEFVPASALL
jgi:hypothetical protein